MAEKNEVQVEMEKNIQEETTHDDQQEELQEEQQEALTGVHEGIIENMLILDLTGIKSTEELQRIKKITNVVVIIVPEELSGALASISKENIVNIMTVPNDSKDLNMKKCTGDLKLRGDELSNPGGDPERDILFVTGDLIIESTITAIGYKYLINVGDIFAPADSRALLNTKVRSHAGSTFYYEKEQQLIHMASHTTFSKEFFELLEEPINLIVSGKLEITEDVTKEVLKEKVSKIILTGLLLAPKHLIPMLQILTLNSSGVIQEHEK